MTPIKFIQSIMRRHSVAAVVRTVVLSVIIVIATWYVDQNVVAGDIFIYKFLSRAILVLYCVLLTIINTRHVNKRITEQMIDRNIEENYELASALIDGKFITDPKIKTMLRQIVKKLDEEENKK